MKQKYLILLWIVFAHQVCAQSNKIAYQAIVRDASNNLVINQAIALKISLHQTTSNGNIVYSEIHNPTTDANGLVSIEIGGGAIVQGFWNSLDWSKGPYFIQKEVDPTGGTNYTTNTTEQLLSVPFALNATSSAGTFTHQLGEFYAGGIIFHLWKDNSGVEHGLIVDSRDLDSVLNFSNENLTLPLSVFNGQANCSTVIANTSNTGTAVEACLNSTNENQTDWYLPSINELVMLYRNSIYFNRQAFFTPILGGKLGFYYSSTVVSTSTNYVYGLDFDIGNIVKLERQNPNGPAKYYVRAIRQF